MNVQLLIDGIVRQTATLVAQLATSSGGRAPLTHVANQIFLDLVAELEGQGVGRKVVADMFGLALRSYQQKVNRLQEGGRFRGRTLWQAVFEFVQDSGEVRRERVLERFRHDDGRTVRSVLSDLCESGLVTKTGRGVETLYKLSLDAGLDPTAPENLEAQRALVWMAVYRNQGLDELQLRALAPGKEANLLKIVAQLEDEGRLTRTGDGWTCAEYSVELGESHGWEAAVFDHYQSVVQAICTKLRNGKTRALPADRIGGSTFTYDIWPGHPLEERVYAQLGSMRAEAGALWDELQAFNAEHPRGEVDRVTFYCGQSVQPGVETVP